MSVSFGLRLYQLLGVLEKSHGMAAFDGLHRQVLNAVIDAHLSGTAITSQDIVEQNFTSRSSTYRKIGDLKDVGFIDEAWDKGVCYLVLGPECDTHFKKVSDSMGSLVIDKA